MISSERGGGETTSGRKARGLTGECGRKGKFRRFEDEREE